MNDSVNFLTTHAYLVIFVWVFSEQIGLPIPSSPILLLAGTAAAYQQV